jgi:RNA polymerase sigma-70 factor (ECF subfamily)
MRLRARVLDLYAQPLIQKYSTIIKKADNNGSKESNNPAFLGMTEFDINKMSPQQAQEFMNKIESYAVKYCNSRGYDFHQAQDFAQEAQVKMLKNPFDPSGGSKFSSYITTILNNIMLDYHKAMGREKRVDVRDTVGLTVKQENESGEGDVETEVTPPTPSYEDEVVLQDFIRELLNQLKPRERDAFILMKLEGYSAREAAEKMGISHAGVNNACNRATIKLQNLLNNTPIIL